LGLLGKIAFWGLTIAFICLSPSLNKYICKYFPFLQNVAIISSPMAFLCILQEDITFDAVSVGAILSDYQRVRVENV